ncbi:hypothetical protein F4803DRAFT_27646 [Xylaria telfairii]|nr:hypothetical protein F4803DRAFT_27646 [Xylaria telfairii]
MALDASDSALSKSSWPSGNKYLVPVFLETLQERLRLLKSKFKHFIETQDPEVGFDLDWMLVHVCEDAFTTIRFIAEQVPPIVPVDAELTSALMELTSELKAVMGDDFEPNYISEIEALPNPEWDAVFQGYCRVLEASVDAYIIGDSPVYKIKLANAAAPDMIFRILRGLIESLGKYPCLQSYHSRLMKKMEGSRSGAIYTQWWMKEVPEGTDPTPKRKLDMLGLDRPAKKRLMKEMEDWPKLDNLLSSPPDY